MMVVMIPVFHQALSPLHAQAGEAKANAAMAAAQEARVVLERALQSTKRALAALMDAAGGVLQTGDLPALAGVVCVCVGGVFVGAWHKDLGTRQYTYRYGIGSTCSDGCTSQYGPELPMPCL